MEIYHLKQRIYHLSKTVFSNATLLCQEVNVEEQGPAIAVQNNYIKNIVMVKWIFMYYKDCWIN